MPDEVVLPDFEKVRWKLAEDMDDKDIEVLLANKDKLNSEEKEAFSNILQASEALPDPANVLDDAINKAVENPENPTNPENPVLPENALPTDHPEFVPEVPTPPTPPENGAITPSQLDTYLEGKRAQWDAEGKSKKDQKTEEQQITFDLFQKGEIPADWNAAVNKFAPAIIKQAEDRIMAKIEAREKEKSDNQTKIQQEYKKTFDAFESEFAQLVTKKFIPDPKTHPEEYKKVHDQIVELGAREGKTNIASSYNLWRIIPEEHGGGLKMGQSPIMTDEAKRKQIEIQKQRAGKIGSGAVAAGSKKAGPRNYNDVHNTNMDDLIEQRLQQP